MSDVNNRPTVGIVTQPTREAGGYGAFGEAYVCAGYVKWPQAAGVQTVVIPWDATEKTIDRLLSSINGVLLPGGPQTVPHEKRYYDRVRWIYQEVVRRNHACHFPLWGTCQGFEQIILSATDFGRELLIGYYHGTMDVALPLHFEEHAHDSRIFRSSGVRELDQAVYHILGHEDVTPNFHRNGVKPESFQSSEKLHPFRVLATNTDARGEPFVSMMEGKNLPIYGVQWHPTLQVFEFSQKLACLHHSQAAILAMQYLANFFAHELRKNHQTILEADLNRYGFNNLVPTFTEHVDGGPIFEQAYFFGPKSPNF